MSVKVIDFHETWYECHDVRAAQPSYLRIYYKKYYLLTDSAEFWSGWCTHDACCRVIQFRVIITVRWYTFWSINGFGTLRDTEKHTWRINDTAHAEWNGKTRTTGQVLMRMLDSCSRYKWPCCLTAWWWRCDAVTWRRVWQWHNGQNVANSVVLALPWKVDNYESAEEVSCFCETQKLDYPLQSVPLLHPNVKLWNSVRYSHTILLLTSVLILSSHQNFGLPGGSCCV